MLDLIDLCEKPDTKSEKEIEQAFQGLIQHSKKMGNPKYLGINDDDYIIKPNGIPEDIKPFLIDFDRF